MGKGKREILLVVALAVLSFFIIFFQARSYLSPRATLPEDLGQGVLHASSKLFSGFFFQFRDLTRFHELLSQAKNLENENLLLRRELASLKAIQAENMKLRRLLGLPLPQPAEVISAQVIARDPDSWFHYIIINRGSLEGLNENSVVVNEEGLVGRVVRLSKHTARVLLLCDTHCAVPAMDAQTSAQGVIYGDGIRFCRMKYIDPRTRINTGDLIVSSGLGGVYPRGIVIGKVTRVIGGEESLFREAQVLPAVNFGELMVVKVVNQR